MCNCHSPHFVLVAITGRHCSRLADLAERDRPNVHPAHYLVLFPTAHKSMRDCHSPRRVSVEITGLRCNQLAGPSPTCAPSTLAAVISDSAPNPCATAAAPTCPGRITSLRAISWRPRPNVHPAHCLLLFPTAHPIHARLPQPTTCPSRRWPHRSLAKTRSELATDPRRIAAS